MKLNGFYVLCFVAFLLLGISGTGWLVSPKVVQDFTPVMISAGEPVVFTGDTVTVGLDLRNLRGAATMFVVPDSTGQTSDSIFSIKEIEIYNKLTNSWAVYYNNASELASVPATVANTQTPFYIPLGPLDSFGWGDKVRFTVGVGTGDTYRCSIYIGGQ